MTLIVRDATEADLSAIMDIYNDAVLNTTAIWNDTVVDLENRLNWFKARKDKEYPVLAAELDGKCVGYASYGDWRAFDGFRRSMEHSVYVRKDTRGTGAGKSLMQELIIRAKQNGVHVLIGAIEAENAASIRLHEKMGFRHVGRFEQVGIKFGRWLDLTCMELRLGEADPT
ncbi:N-acetyltransferase family protein [Agrobacterium sp. AGB01]|uniref:GNAT family N-acetyltransferase n=1 Tax=Agrobacterium sp. AGB01 TaxID=2769302 RepID=UPI001781C059|nr:GNAT family N-acetyltransferase [Agrobacterium sp. AGB01]MBD9386333.1 N-acetyltransferase family protein [Agrobacterium sp. AGB01]